MAAAVVAHDLVLGEDLVPARGLVPGEDLAEVDREGAAEERSKLVCRR